jgi:hypothetical protein
VHRQNYKTEDNEGSKDSEESIEAANFPDRLGHGRK